MNKKERAELFRETIAAVAAGAYQWNGAAVRFARGKQEHTQVEAFLPQDVAAISLPASGRVASGTATGRCIFDVTPDDSFEAAYSLIKEAIAAAATAAGRDSFPGAAQGGGASSDASPTPNAKPVLVMNFASARHPGGGVLRGARAQEEDLCRRSTLYASISSPAARPFYELGERAGFAATDGMLISPHVEVFRAADGSFLPRPFEVAVVTIAAPYRPGLGDIPNAELAEIFTRRIEGMLRVTAAEGYRNLVLGAWGCGAFHNDPNLVADAFHAAFTQVGQGFLAAGADVDGSAGSKPTIAPLSAVPFDHVRFAVLAHDEGDPNLAAFRRAFG